MTKLNDTNHFLGGGNMVEVKMPEPVVWVNLESLESVGKVKVLTRIWLNHRKTDEDDTGLLTTALAEAYAEARVREALEEAAVVAERSFCDCCCSDDQKFTAEDTAQSIRALIKKENKT